jgi:hypothetical protein
LSKSLELCRAARNRRPLIELLTLHRLFCLRITRQLKLIVGNLNDRISCKSSLSTQQLKKQDSCSATPNRRHAYYQQNGSVQIMPIQPRYPEDERHAHPILRRGTCALHFEEQATSEWISRRDRKYRGC